MKPLLSISFWFLSLIVSAQISRLGQDIMYMGEVSANVSSGDQAPFWLSTNRYGLSSIDPHSGYTRGAINRPISADSLRKWQIGYGIDMAAAADYTSSFIMHQLYAEAQYEALRLTFGAKEFGSDFANKELSSGGMAIGFNARPIPQLRLETHRFVSVPLTNHWLGVKVMIAYGKFTDGNWQKDFTRGNGSYSTGSLFHHKSIYFKIGNEQKYPLTFTGGIEFATQFGGEAWNLKKRDDDYNDTNLSHVKMGTSLKDFWDATFFGGSDPNDGDYLNASGNHVGSWHGSLLYENTNWSVRGYFEHFFEDHSQLFWQYGWKDMTWGIEAKLPRNPIVNTVVAELLSTKDQTGGIYHDATSNLPVQVSGIDNYYYHHVYGGWQHWGMGLGNPLLISPIYNQNHQINFYHSRVQAIHIGLSGNPTAALSYRLLYSKVKSWGTYTIPLTDTETGHFLLAEATYRPVRLCGWSLTGALGVNGGDLLGHTTGFSLSLRKEGLLR